MNDRKMKVDSSSYLPRRAMLKATGAGPLVGLATIGQASNGNHPSRYVGVTYDTVTHEAQGQCTAQFDKGGNEIDAKFHVPGMNLRLGKEESDHYMEGNKEVYQVRKNGSEHKEDNSGLNILLKREGDQIHGYVTRPHAKYSKLGFTLVSDDEKRGQDNIRGCLRNRGNGIKPKEVNASFSVPKEGVPQDTSMKNINKLRNSGDL